MASINEPFALSSYALPSHQASSSSSTRLPHVLVADTSVSSDKGDDWVTIAVQGDGVHILDLSSLHPAVSHTFGPSTSFVCPPATRTSRQGGSRSSTTAVAIDQSPEIGQNDKGKAVWMWDEDLSGGVASVEARKKRKTAVMKRPVSSIYTHDELPDHLLLVSPEGDLDVIDADLNIRATSTPQAETQGSSIKHFVFPRRTCNFISGRNAPSNGIVFTALIRRDEKLRVSLTAIDREGSIVPLGECDIPLNNTNVADVSFSSTGYISILMRSGKWHSFHLSQSTSTTSSEFHLRTPTPPFQLTSLSFISTSAHAMSYEVSLLALSDSHVLLAGFANGDIVLLLWDMQYGIVLSEQRRSIPTTLGKARHQQRRVHVTLTAAPGNQALLVLCPAHTSQTSENKLHSSILVVPYDVPERSTIANALGRATSSAKWIKASGEKIETVLDADHTEVIRALKSVLQKKGSAEEVEKTFMDWVAEQQKKKQDQGKTSLLQDATPHLGHIFVKQVLDIILQPRTDSAPDPRYASKIVRYLLERRAISNGMVVGGLLPALIFRNDWLSAVLALKSVKDLPEADIISLLARVVAHHRQKDADTSAMRIDSPADSSIPDLLPFLTLCVTYAVSPVALRVALRDHVDVEDVICVLGALDGWIAQWCEEDVKLLPDRIKKDAHGVPVPLYAERKTDLPPLNKVLEFTQSILDASFLALLAHNPAHKILRTLLAHLQPELALFTELQSLSGPLQPFAKAHARLVHEGAHGTQKVDPKVDWRRKQKVAHEQAEMHIGTYQFEELMI